MNTRTFVVSAALLCGLYTNPALAENTDIRAPDVSAKLEAMIEEEMRPLLLATLELPVPPPPVHIAAERPAPAAVDSGS